MAEDLSKFVPVSKEAASASADSANPLSQFTPIQAGPPTSTSRQAAYGFASSVSLEEYAAITLESFFPLGGLFESPRELYGDAFVDEMTQEQRRDFLVKRRQEKINQEYSDVVAANQTDTLYSNVGGFVGTLLTPSSLLPISSSLKGMTIGSGFYGGIYDVAQQYTETGQVNPVQTAAVTALSAGGGAGFHYGAKGLAIGFKNLARAKTAAKTEQYRRAQQNARQINKAADEGVKSGVEPSGLLAWVKQRTGFDQKKINETVAIAGDDIVVPTKVEAQVADIIGKEGLDTINRVNNSFLSKFLEPISYRIEKLSPALSLRLRKLDQRFHEQTYKRMQAVKPFAEAFKQLGPNSQKAVKRLLSNGSFSAVKKILDKEVPNSGKTLDAVQDVLDNIANELESVGYDFNRIQNYFPRGLNDRDGLLALAGKQKETLIKRLWKEKADALDIDVEDLPDIEKEKILNNVLRGMPDISGGGIPGNLKARKIQSLTDEMLDFYDDPIKALENYIRYSTNNIEKRAFFGGKKAAGLGEVLDTDASIGTLVNREFGDTLSDLDRSTLRDLLKARFVNGEKGSDKAIQVLRNTAYLTKLTNPLSALIQLGDIGMSAWINGMGDTFATLLSTQRRVTMEELGLDQVLAEEFVNEKVMAKVMHKFFTYSGFRKIDKLGKNIFLESALKKAERLAKSDAGVAALKKKNGEAFGAEFENLVDDLKNGKITDNVKLYLWNELADAQPVSLAEMPQKFLESPNGRFMYALKTFALRQLFTAKKNTIDLYNKGGKENQRQAIKNLITFAAIVPTTNMSVDMGRDILMQKKVPDDPDDLLIRYGENALRMFGASDYMLRKVARGDIEGVLIGSGGLLTPPLNTLTIVGRSIANTIENGEVDTEMFKELPLIGKIWYNFYGGGLEKNYDEYYKEL